MNTLPLLRNNQDIEEQLQGLSISALRILHIIVCAEESLTTKELSKRAGLSRSPILNHAKKLEQKGLIIRESIPHRNPDMPPTYRYSSTNADTKALAEVLNRKLAEQAKSEDLLERQQEPAVLQSNDLPPLPENLENIFAEIKPAYREGYWKAFMSVSRNGSSTASFISKENGWGSSVTHSRLMRLVDLGLLERRKVGKDLVYCLTQDARKICIKHGILHAENLDIEDLGSNNFPVSKSDLNSQYEPSIEIVRSNSHQTESIDSSSRTMSQNTQNEIAAAIQYLASEIAKLNQRVDQIEQNQQIQHSGLKLDDIKRIVHDRGNDQT